MKKVVLLETFNTSLGKKIIIKTDEIIRVGDTVITDTGDVYIVRGLTYMRDPNDDRISISV